MLNPHATLIKTNCETIRSANRVVMREPAHRAIRDSARATVAALERITEGLLDEELAGIGRIQTMVACSGSLALTRHLASITGRRITLDPDEWRITLLHVGPDRVRELIDGPLTARNLGLNVLEQIHEGRPELVPLLEEVAPLDEAGTVNNPLIFDTNVPEQTALFLHLQAAAFPDRYKEMAREAAGQMAMDSLALLFLLGVDMPDPKEVGFGESTQFLERISSSHGRIQAHADLGALESYLVDPKRHRRSHRAATGKA